MPFKIVFSETFVNSISSLSDAQIGKIVRAIREKELFDKPNEDPSIEVPFNLYYSSRRAKAINKVDLSVAIQDRKQKFGLSLEPYKDKYPREMLRQFFIYWGEPTQDKKKLKFELQQTWDLEGRLETWHRRDNGKTQDTRPQDKQYKTIVLPNELK